MSEQSPTVGELKRKNEDLEARVEELEIRLGLLDEDEESGRQTIQIHIDHGGGD